MLEPGCLGVNPGSTAYQLCDHRQLVKRPALSACVRVQTVALTTAELPKGFNEQICVKLVEKCLAKSKWYLWVSLLFIIAIIS